MLSLNSVTTGTHFFARIRSGGVQGAVGMTSKCSGKFFS